MTITKRLVETSNGWIVLGLTRRPYGRFLARFLGGGHSVVVTRFGPDGWQREEDIGWLSDRPYQGQTLDAFLADVASVPLAEAQQIVREIILEEWEQREPSDTPR